MIKSDLLNKKYYLDRMSMFLKESYGISNSSGTGQLDILLMIMNSFNDKEKELLKLLNVMDYNSTNIKDVAELLGYENEDSFYASTNCPFLDTVASIIGISRNISWNSQDLTLDNKDLITYIKFTVCNSNFNGSLGDLIDKYESSGIECAIEINGNMTNTINFLVDQFDDSDFVNFIRSGNLLPNVIGVKLNVHIISQDYVQVLFDNATAKLEIDGEEYEIVSGEIFGLAKGMEYTLTITSNDNYYIDTLNGFTPSGDPMQITTSEGVNGDHYKEYSMTDTVPDNEEKYVKEIDLRSNIHKYYNLTLQSYSITNYMGVSNDDFELLEGSTQYVSENTIIYMKHVVSGENYVSHNYKKSLLDTDLSVNIPLYVDSVPRLNNTDYFTTLVTKGITIDGNKTLNVSPATYYVITFNNRIGGSLKFGNLDVPKAGESYNFLPIGTSPVITYNWQNQYIFKSGNLPSLGTIGRTEVYNMGVLNNEITSFTTLPYNIASIGNITFNLTLEKVYRITIKGTNGFNTYSIYGKAQIIKFANTQTFDDVVTTCHMSSVGGSTSARYLYYIGYADFYLDFFSFIKTDMNNIVQYYYTETNDPAVIPNECKGSYFSRVINVNASTFNGVTMKDNTHVSYDEHIIRDSFMDNDNTYVMDLWIGDGNYHNEDISIDIVYENVKTAYIWVQGWSDYGESLYIENSSHYLTNPSVDPGDDQTLCIASPDETLGELDLILEDSSGYRLSADAMRLPYSATDNTEITYVSIIKD